MATAKFEDVRATIRRGSPEQKYEAVLDLPECDGSVVEKTSYVIELMRMADENLLGAATRVLSEFGVESVPVLEQTLQDTDARIRWRAAKALGSLGGTAEAALPALKASLGDDEKRVQIWARKAIQQIEG